MVLNLSTEIPQRRAEYEAKLKTFGTGTVGCVVLDSKGKIAVATSGGKVLKFRDASQIQLL
jgi:L-asparaginase